MDGKVHSIFNISLVVARKMGSFIGHSLEIVGGAQSQV
jgi:hypothetical protein